MRSELETSRDQLSGLYEFAPIGYVTLDSEAKVVRANLTVCEMLETHRSKLLGHSLLKWIAPEKHHEIRTPMNGILGMLQLLEQGRQDSESQKYITAAKSSAETLLTIISDVLDLSKIEAGKLETKTESVPIRPLIEDVQKLFEHRSAQTSVPLRVDVDQGIPDRIVGDGVRIRQVLFNLIGNAFKFTDEGEIRLEVRRREAAEGGVGEIAFTVTDTGVGMSPDLLEGVLQPFLQANPNRTEKTEGTGLGLSIVNRLVEIMGGTFSLDSAPDKGTRATFTVPWHKAEDPSPLESPAQTDVDADSSPTQAAETYRLLVAEDNAINSLVMTTMLERLGHEAHVARDGLEALKLLEAEHFDAVLMDIQMPNMDGVECTKRIRNGESRAPKDIPIIALTAYAMDAEKTGFRDAGIDSQLTKPIYLEALQRELPKLIGRRRKH